MIKIEIFVNNLRSVLSALYGILGYNFRAKKSGLYLY